MTNQQGAPEALRPEMLDDLIETFATAGLGRCNLMRVELPRHQWAQLAVALSRLHAENERLAALVEAQQPAPSAAGAVCEVPLPLLVRDIAADLGTTPIQVCTALAQLGFGGHSVNMAVTPRMAQSLRAHFASTTPQADSAPTSGKWVSADDVNRLVRELDVALNGEAGAAVQASLCDVVAQVRLEAAKRGHPLLAPQADSQPAKVPTSATGGDWTQPTTVALRLGDAIQLLCGGKRPPDDMVQQWLDNTSESLQEFAASNGPAWAQGIGLIDAAMVMVDQPTEITTIDNPDRDHEHRAASAPADSVTAPAGGANWAQLRSALAMLMLGWGRNPNQTMDACYRVLDSATEPGTALAILRTAPDWRSFMAADRAKADSVLEDAASAGFFLQFPQRPKPEAPAGTVGLDWDAYSGAQMLAYGRDCSNAAIVAAQKPGGL